MHVAGSSMVLRDFRPLLIPTDYSIHKPLSSKDL
jgi:hypothetical protein